MAVLNKIRQRSLVLILVIALALFAFVIGDVFRNLDSTGSAQDTVATINGQDISRQPFMTAVQNMQQRSGPNTSETQIKNNIYNQELRRIVMSTDFEKLGLSVEKDKMRDLLETSFGSYPEFQNQDSIFDVNKLNAFIANLKDIQPQAAPLGNFNINYPQWTNNEQQLATGALQQQYYNLVKAGVNATVTEAKDDYIADSKSVDIKYVQVPYTSIPDDQVSVSDAEIKAYMEKNKEAYKVDATREILFVEFREDASVEDEDQFKADLLALRSNKLEFNDNTKATDTVAGFDATTNIEAFVNSNSDIKYSNDYLRAAQLGTFKDDIAATEVGAYYGPYKEAGFYKYSKVLDRKTLPDSVKVRHILLPFVGSTMANAEVTKTKEEVKVTADSIYNLVRRNRSNFTDFLDMSADKASIAKDGELDVTYNQGYPPLFKSYIFENDKGDLSVVESTAGFHIVEILDQTAFGSTVKLATVAREIEASERTIDDVFNAKQKFEIAAESGDFRALAEEKGKTAKPVTFKVLDENIPGLGSQRQVVRWAFDDETEVGDYKSFPVAGVGFVVAQLVDINKEGLMSVDAARAPVSLAVKKEKKAKMIREKLTSGSLADIANAQGQTVKTANGVKLKTATITGAGAEPKVVGAAYGLTQGKVSNPIDGNQGVYVIEVTNINEATTLENYSAILARLSNARKNAVQTKVYSALEAKADIEDNRAKTVY